MANDHAISLSEYQEGLAQNGLKCYRGAAGDLWMQHEVGTMLRIPAFRMGRPSSDEENALFWKLHVPAASYLIAPDSEHSANAWLYICERDSYSLEKLARIPRRNVKNAQKNLRFEFVSWDDLLKYGVEAFCDTRTRVGLSDGTPEHFRAHFSRLSRVPGQRIAGAWAGDTLAGFLSLIVVDNWVEIMGTFSATRQLALFPNDGLYAFSFDHFLVQNQFEVVHAGLSSAQQADNLEGLHRFKLNVGLEARPVHRVFNVHPLIQPFINPLSLVALQTLQKIRPKNRKIRKATGMVDTLINKRGLPVGEKPVWESEQIQGRPSTV